MRVLLVADLNAIHSRRYVDIIKAGGCDVALLHTSARPPQQADVPCETWPRTGRRVLGRLVGRESAKRMSDALLRARLRRIWKRSGADICHVQWVGEPAGRIADSGIAPLILTAWGSDINAVMQSGGADAERRRKAETVSAADMIIADSRDMIAKMEVLTGRTLRSTLLPLGIDTDLFKPMPRTEALHRRRALGIPDDAKVALSPRIFRRHYCHHVMVKAFAEALRLYQGEAYLVFKLFELTDEDYLDAVKSVARQCGIEDRVRFVDSVPYEQLPAFYAMGDFAINLPEMDAFPVTFLECWACELPVLTRLLPAYDDDEFRRFLNFADCSSETALAREIHAMLVGSDELRAKTVAARQYVARTHTVEATARRLMEAYRGVLEGAA